MNRKLKSSLSMFLSAAIAASSFTVVASAKTDNDVQATDVISIAKAAVDSSEMPVIKLAAKNSAPITPVVYAQPIEKLDLPAEGVGPFTCGSTSISISGDGVLTVSGTGAMADLADGNAASTSAWSSYVDSVKEIVIADGVTTVGSFCFNGFTSVKKVTIGTGVTTIGDDSFAGCTALETLTINSTKLERFGIRAFRDCSPITALTIPNSVTFIGDEAFLGCNHITEVTIPGGVAENLGAGAFYGCTAIQKAVISEGVTMIKENTFSDCSALTTLDLPESTLISIGASAFNTCAALSDIDGAGSTLEIPASVTSIGDTAFNGCKSITALIIGGNKLTKIGDEAFKTCEALKSISITGGNGLTIGVGAFAGTKSLVGVTMGSGNISKLDDEVFMSSGVQTITLPNTLKTIGERTFQNSQVASISIPASVTSIGEEAFKNCIALTTFKVIDDNRTTDLDIERNALIDCTALTTVDLSGTKSIDQTAFSGCTALESITLPSSLTSMGLNAFKGCTKLSKVDIEEGAKVIGQQAFDGCTALTSITIPSSVTTSTKAFQNNANIKTVVVKCPSLGSYMFDGCTSLTDVTLVNTVTIGSNAFKNSAITTIALPNTLENINDSAFEGCAALTTLAIPDGVTIISKNMLKNATSLQSVTFKNIVTINTSAFENCTSLQKIELPNTVTALNPTAFKGCTSLQNVIIPSSVNTIGSGLFAGCTSFTEMTLPDGLLQIPNNIFDGCTSLHTVHVSPNATDILEYAFNNCSSLKGFTIPSTVTVIENNAFTNCVLLDTPLPSGLTELGEAAFSGCKSLGKTCTIVLPTSEEYVTIEKSTFKNCSSMASPAIPTNIAKIAEEAFYGCSSTNFKRIDITGNVTSIAKNAFAQCTNLDIVNITSSSNGGCKEIGESAFDGCTKLRSVPLPSTLTTIGKNAFNNCKTLNNVTVPNKVTSIGESAFNGCTSLAKISIGSTQIDSIPKNLFNGCTVLETVELPSTITAIGGYAFANCEALKTITIPVNVTKIDGFAFTNCSSLEYVVIPAAVTTFGTSAFDGCSKLESAIVLPVTAGPAATSKFFANCHPKLTIYCYADAKIITYATYAKINYELMENSDGTYVVFLKHPQSVCGANIGDTANLNVKVAAEGAVTYKWYYKNHGETEFKLADSFTDSTYSVTVSNETNGQQVYCMATSTTDNGKTNTVRSNTAIISTLNKPVVTLASKTPANITIKWDAVDSAAQYKVYRTESSSSVLGDPIATLDKNTTSYSDSNVTAQSTYYYYVIALNSDGVQSGVSDVLSVTVPTTIDVVTKITATPGNKKVTLTWEPVAGAEKYAVFYSTNHSSYKQLTNSLTDTTYTAEGLTNETEYSFKLKAYGFSKWTNYSEAVYATPTAATNAPTGVTATPGDGKITLSWNAVNGATQYAVSIYDPATKKYTATYKCTDTSYTVTGLTNGKVYEFLVQSYVNGAWSDASTDCHVQATPVAATKPEPTATAGEESVTLSWKAINGATKYAVSSYINGKYNTYTNTLTSTSYTVTGLTGGVEYEFLVQAYIDGKWTSASTEDHVKATPLVSTKPKPTATPADSAVVLNWAAVKGATKYAVSVYSGGKYFVQTNSLTSTTYTVKPLTNGVTYQFLVQAYVDGKWSTASTADLISCAPVAEAKPKPTATPADGAVVLNWEAVKGATKYAVSVYSGGKYFVQTTELTDTTYTVMPLKNGVTYQFLVQAYINGKWTTASTADLISCTPQA